MRIVRKIIQLILLTIFILQILLLRLFIVTALTIPELDVVETIVKPDLNQVLRPPSPAKQLQNSKVTNLALSLKAAFDEKSLFSKYVIESEQRMKQFHQELLKEDALQQKLKVSSLRKNSSSISSSGSNNNWNQVANNKAWKERCRLTKLRTILLFAKAKETKSDEDIGF